MKEKKYFIERLHKLLNREDLSREESFQCLKYLLDHKFDIANDSCFGAFFASMQTKKPTIDEIAGLMDCVMNYDCDKLDIDRSFSEPLCGIIGSGKDELKTFNISSISSIVSASCGVKVLKNGSRSEASVAGTTDVFEYLGLNVLQRNKKIIEEGINKYNFGFCDVEPYFPRMNKEYMGKFFFVHPLSFILPIASGIKFDRVLFGLANDNTELTAKLLVKLGYNNSIVVAGHDLEGHVFDEISVVGKTKVSEIKDGNIKTYYISPEDFGMSLSKKEEILEGSSVKENADIFLNILNNKASTGQMNTILINAGMLNYLAGISSSVMDGINLAREHIENKDALKLLNNIIELYGDKNV